MSDDWDDIPEQSGDPVEIFIRKFQKGYHLYKYFFILGVLLIVGAVAAVSMVYTVEPEEEAVILRFGKYVSTEEPGLHFKMPFGIDQAIKIATKKVHQEEFGFRSGARDRYTGQRLKEESLTLTGDLNVADVEWIVQYQISNPQKFLFNTRDVLKNLRDVSQSVLRRVVGDRLVSDVLTTGRTEIAEEAHRLTQEVLDRYDIGLRIVTVKLQDVNPPEQVKAAFNEVNEAKQEQEEVINNAEQAYNKVIPEAKGKAEKTIRAAEGYATAQVNQAQGDAERFKSILKAYRTAPTVTRTRLYLETMEELYKRFEKVTIVDKGVEGLLPVFSGNVPVKGKEN